MREAAGNLGRRILAVAIVVLALALLLKFAIGLVVGFVHLVFWTLVAVAVLAAVLWAFRVL